MCQAALAVGCNSLSPTGMDLLLFVNHDLRVVHASSEYRVGEHQRRNQTSDWFEKLLMAISIINQLADESNQNPNNDAKHLLQGWPQASATLS